MSMPVVPDTSEDTQPVDRAPESADNPYLAMDNAPAAQAPEPAPKPEAPLASDNPYIAMDQASANPVAQRLKVVAQASADIDPSKAAKIIQLQRTTGLDQDTIKRNFDDVNSSVENGFDTTQYAKQNPAIAGFASQSPAHAAAVKPYAAPLSQMESSSQDHGFWTDMGKELLSSTLSFGSGLAKSIGGVIAAAQAPGNIISAGLEKTGAEVPPAPNASIWDLITGKNPGAPTEPGIEPQHEVPDWALKSPVTEFLDKLAEQTKPIEMNQQVTELIRQHRYEDAGKAAAIHFVGAVPQVASIIGGMASGLGSIPLVAMGLSTAGESLAKNKEAGVEPAENDLDSLIKGAATAGMEGFAVMNPLKGLVGAMEKDFGTEAAKSVIVPMLKHLIGTTAKDSISMSALTVTNELTDYLTGVNPDALKNVVEDSVNAAIDGGVMGAILGTPGAYKMAVERRASGVQAETNANWWRSMGSSTKSIELFNELPEAKRELIGRMTEGKNMDTVYIPIESIEEHFQTKAPELMAQAGLADEYAEAKKTGGDMQIPLNKWADHFVNTDAHEALANDVKFMEPGKEGQSDKLSMSVNEYKESVEAAKKAQELNKTEVANDEESKNPTEEPKPSVQDKILKQLSDAGVPADRAKHMAVVIDEILGREAEKRGMSPVDLLNEKTRGNPLYQNSDLEAKKGTPKYDELNGVINRIRAGDVPAEESKSGASLNEFLRQKGGINPGGHPLAGDLTSLEADKDLKPFQGKLVNPDSKNSIDYATTLAHESGYLSDSDSNELLNKISKELGGEKTYSNAEPSEENVNKAQHDARVRDVARRIKNMGIDLGSASNDEVRERLKAGEGLTEEPFLQEGTGDASNVISAAERFTKKINTSEELPQEEEKKLSASEQVDRLKARFGDDKKALKAIDKAQDPKKGPYVEQKSVKGFIGFPNFSSEPTGTIGSPKIQESAPSGGKGGDPLPWADVKWGATKQLIEKHASEGIPLTINTSSDLVSHDDYVSAMGPDTTVNMYLMPKGDFRELIPGNPSRQRQEIAIEKLRGEGVTVNAIEPSRESILDAVGGREEAKKRIGERTPKGTVEATDEQLDSYLNRAMNERPSQGNVTSLFFQDGKDIQGSFEKLVGGLFRINLTGSANESTPLHEAGHMLLELARERSDLNDDSKKEFESIKNYLGVGEDGKVTREQHERFARDFEQYLMEGKTPNPKLQGAFARIKDYLLQIYRKFKNVPGSNLTDEGRAVFDRLLATQDQIEAAKHEQHQGPLIESFMHNGAVSPEDTARYNAALANAKAQAEDTLLKQVMSELDADRAKKYKEAKDKIREEVTKDVTSRQEHIARDTLRNIEKPGEPKFKLDRQAIVDQFGKERLKGIKGTYRKEGGIHPDAAAEQFGYSSGDELLHAIENTPKTSDAISRETEARMRKEHPSLIESGALHDRAMEAIHNDYQSEVHSIANEIMAKSEAARLSGDALSLKRKLPVGQFLKANAEKEMASKSYLETNPIIYQRAESKANRLAKEHLLAGNIKEAFDENTRAWFNHEMYKAAVKSRAEFDSGQKYASKSDTDANRSRLGLAGKNYLDAHDAIMERYEFRKGVSSNQIERRQALNKFVEAQQVKGYDSKIPDGVLQDAKQVSYKTLPLEQFRTLVDMLKMIDAQARLKNEYIANRDGRTYEQDKTDLHNSVAQYHDLTPKQHDLNPGALDKAKRGIQSFIADNRRIEHICTVLDGHQELGKAWQTMFKPMVEAQDAKTAMTHEFNQKVHDIFSVYGEGKEASKLFTDKTFYKELDRPKLKGSFTKANLLMMALNYGNDYNREALLSGYGWSDHDVRSAFSKGLDSRDWAVVKNVWGIYEELWPKISALEEKMSGFAPDKVAHNPFQIQTSDGKTLSLEGGYHPIKFDKEQSVRQEEFDEKQNIAEQFGSTLRASTRQGHTESRTNTGGNKLSLDMSVIDGHLHQVIHDLTHREAVIDVSKFIFDKDTYEMLQTAVGKDQAREFKFWLKRVAGSYDLPPSTGAERFIRGSQRNATIATIGFKASSYMVHLANLPRLVDAIGAKWILSGANDVYGPRNLGRLSSTIEEVNAKSSHMRNLLENKEVGMKDLLGENNPIQGADPGMKQKLTEASLHMIHLVDKGMHLPLWMGAYNKAMSGEAENVVKGNEAEAIKFADSIARQTLMAGEAKDVTRTQAGGTFQKLITMFFSPLAAWGNQIYNTGSRFSMSEKSISDYGRLASGMTLQVLLPTLIEELVRGKLYNPDEDKKKPFSWLDKVLLPTLLAVPEKIPGISGIASSFERAITEGRRVEYSGSPAVGAIQNVIQGAASLGKIAHKAIGGESDKITRREVRDVAEGTGFAAGLPTRQVWTTLETLFDWNTGKYNPPNFGIGLARAATIGEPKKH